MSDQVRAPQSPLHKKGENAMVLEVFESKAFPVQMDYGLSFQPVEFSTST